MYCKNCWQKNEESYNFCRNCGANVVYYNKKNESMHCSHCNSIVLSTDKYCKNCGYEFKNTNDRYNYIFIEKLSNFKSQNINDEEKDENYFTYNNYSKSFIEDDIKNYSALRYMRLKMLGGVKMD